MKTKAKFLSVKDTTISFLEFVKKFSTEYKAFVYLEKIRWGESGIVCPYCGEKITYNCNRKEGRHIRKENKMKNRSEIANELYDELEDCPKKEYPLLKKGRGYLIEYFRNGKKIFVKDVTDVSLPEVDSELGKGKRRKMTEKSIVSVAQSCFRSIHDIGYEEGPLYDKILCLVGIRYEFGNGYDIHLTSYDRTGNTYESGLITKTENIV